MNAWISFARIRQMPPDIARRCSQPRRIARRSGGDAALAGRSDRDHLDRHALVGHRLPDPDLAGLAQFHLAVDPDRAAGDDRLAGAAAVAQAGQLEQLVEFDMVVAGVEFEADRLHEAMDDEGPSRVAALRLARKTFAPGPAYSRVCSRVAAGGRSRARSLVPVRFGVTQ